MSIVLESHEGWKEAENGIGQLLGMEHLMENLEYMSYICVKYFT